MDARSVVGSVGGERGEFSRKLSLRRDDNGNPIEAVHLRRVMVAVWYFNWEIAINPGQPPGV